jgi:5'-nucleotidase
MKILVSNDDGVYAPGIAALAHALSENHDVTVVGPDRNCSGASNSLTLDRPVRVTKTPNGFYSVNGTPTDCVHLALTGMLDFEADIVMSGINEGSNMGDDVIYSGTVAAATEGRYLGFPAMAFSLMGPNFDYYDTAAKVARRLLAHVQKHPIAPDTILNVNIPDIPINKLNGYKVTRLGNRHRAEPAMPSKDPRGRIVYWVGPAGKEEDAGPGTDFHAVHNSFVSITPLQIDLTRYSAMDELKDWISKL